MKRLSIVNKSHNQVRQVIAEWIFKTFGVLFIVLPILSIVGIFIHALIAGGAHFTDTIWLTAFLFPAVMDSLKLMGLVGIISIPFGMVIAIYLEEYADNCFLSRLVEMVTTYLSSIPSVVYGIVGGGFLIHLTRFQPGLLVCAITLSWVVLPLIIKEVRDGLSAVPNELRESGYALGSDKWKVIFYIVLPHSALDIFTGLIAALARAIGEAAPVIAFVAIASSSSHFSPFSILPIRIFEWVSNDTLHSYASAGVVVLLLMVMCLNGISIWLRLRYRKRSTQI